MKTDWCDRRCRRAGKSEILNYMKSNYNCRILLADEVARALEAPGGAIYQPLIRLLEQFPAKEILQREKAAG